MRCGPSWAVVLDGATAPDGVHSGCVHDVRWLVSQLGDAIADRLAGDDTRSLPDIVADAVAAVGGYHGGACDLQNPDSPSSTVAVVRWDRERVEYLVLADSPVLLQTVRGVRVVADDRLDRMPDRTRAAVTRSRNTDGGFWVASTRPEAAHRAVTGSMPREQITAVALLTDGATRYVDRFQLGDWTDLIAVLTTAGPDELIRRVRAAESAEPEAARLARPRPGKRHDDATAVVVTFDGSEPGQRDA